MATRQIKMADLKGIYTLKNYDIIEDFETDYGISDLYIITLKDSDGELSTVSSSQVIAKKLKKIPAGSRVQFEKRSSNNGHQFWNMRRIDE